MKRSSLANRYCPIARAGAELMDGWTFVILREVMMTNSRFDGLQEQTGMSPRSLTLRLKLLVGEDILEKSAYSDKPQRFEYLLTPKGEALWPVIITLKQWGEDWCGPWQSDGVPMRLGHSGHDHDMEPAIVCKHCNEPIYAHSGVPHMSQSMESDRVKMAASHAENTKPQKP